MKISKKAKIYVAGHKGLAGSAIFGELISQGYKNVFGVSSNELNLLNRDAVFDYVKAASPDVIIDAAAKVGGIQANNNYPADFISQNLQIQLNLLDAANNVGVERFLFLGSSCIYPKFAHQPISETSLLTGALEPTNDAYAIAKIAGIMQVQASRRQFGRQWISAMPTNLYGPGDNFHPENSHVMPALIRRIHEAKELGLEEVVIWGSGKPRREFLHVSDFAKALVFLLNHYDSDEIINVGVGKDISISELAALIVEVVGYQGKIVQDTNKPDGTPRKVLDVSKINNLGWFAEKSLAEGIRETYEWYLENIQVVRSK